MSTSLRELIDEGNNQKAMEKGQRWMDKNAQKPKHRQEADVIVVLVCEAEYNLTEKTDTVDGYRYFRNRYSGVRGVDEFLDRALSREASAYYRDVTTREDTVAAYQDFQKSYPDAFERGRALAREAELALARAEGAHGRGELRSFLDIYGFNAEAAPSVAKARILLVTREFEAAVAAKDASVYRSFLAEFDSWPEAAPFIPQARKSECDLAFEAAMASRDAVLLREFRAYYGEWPEAVLLEPQAYDAEAELAMKAAEKADDITSLKFLRQTWTRNDWPARINDSIAIVLVRFIRTKLESRIALSPGQVDLVLREAEGIPTFQERAQDIRKPLIAFARSEKSPGMLFLAARIFPAPPDGPKLLKAAEDLYWKELVAADEADGWLRFTKWFPLCKRAPEAEQRYLWHVEIANRNAFGLFAKVTRTIRQPNGDIDVYVDVRDKYGKPVVGLTKDAFRVFKGSINGDIVGFWGMEEDRPLDIIFDIDMSGSMQTERDAVRQAVVHFASTLDFRGREANLGLVSFSDQVIDRHTPSPDTNKFVSWMVNLSNATGGASGEDGGMALMDTTAMLRGSRGERVAIFLSDEAFQINVDGRNALGFSPAPPCSSSYLRGCGDPIYFRDSNETVKLTKEMDRVQVRPFFLVIDDHADWKSSYTAMAESLQGSVLVVPDDSREAGPYINALMQIAEQLSRQYVIRYRPRKAMAPKAELAVVVRPIHRWSGFGTIPPVDVKGLVTLNDNKTCPEFMLFSTAGIYVSSACGTRWSPLEVNFPSPVVDVRVQGRHALMATADNRLLLWGIDSRELHLLTFDNQHMPGFFWEGDDGFWVTGYGADKSIVAEYRKLSDHGSTSRAFQIPFESGFGGGGRLMAYPVVLRMAGQGGDNICILVAADRMMCSTSDPAVWTTTKVSGLPAAALAGTSTVQILDAHDRVYLLAGADGALYRSISGGAIWERVLDPIAGKRTLSVFNTTPRLVCATSTKDVQCSEDAGARFFPLGLGFLDGRGAALAQLGGLPALAADGEIQRLLRVLNRELPSSAVYFETNMATPSAQMLPFLRTIASDMLSSPGSMLRIEGHADARGTSEHNEELARNRADAVAEVMVSFGVPRERLMVLSFGERRPIQSGTSQRALSRNRRVELIMLKETPSTWYER